MGYRIVPHSLKVFIDDRSIRLPRFQRKQTWNDKKNFLLAVSIFKGYPIGVTILNFEKSSDGNTTKWLLDGRQRRNALTIIYDDPERIYFWAKSYLAFTNKTSIDDINEKFWKMVNDYIESDESDDEVITGAANTNLNNNTHQVNRENQMSGLRTLLSLIKVCHNTTINGTQFTRKFDFSDFFVNLSYRSTINGIGKLNSGDLKSVIFEYVTYCKRNTKEYSSMESFFDYFVGRYQLISRNSSAKFRHKLEQNWADILERIEIVLSIEDRLISENIGVIEIENISTTDAQKIFNIINTGGSLLSAAEVLSAKPTWNLLVRDPSDQLKEKKDDLYKLIGTSTTDVVRWDIPATLLARIDNNNLLYPNMGVDHLERRISLGFKLMAGIFEKGVKKEDIDLLNNHTVVSNIIDYEEFIRKFNEMIMLISGDPFFGFVLSWRKSIMELLSEAVMLNFAILMFREYRSSNYSNSASAKKTFKKKAFILFDKLVYEYTKRKWRGSSDSTISKNIESLSQNGDIFVPVAEVSWKNLIDEIFESATIDGTTIDQYSVTPILYHHYYLSNIRGPSLNDIKDSIEVDHILPKSVIDNSQIEGKSKIINNLYNLQLLPKRENISKSNNRLNQITDAWLKSEILIYSGISESEFAEFSDVGNYISLKNKRYLQFISSFITSRTSKLNN